MILIRHFASIALYVTIMMVSPILADESGVPLVGPDLSSLKPNPITSSHALRVSDTVRHKQPMMTSVGGAGNKTSRLGEEVSSAILEYHDCALLSHATDIETDGSVAFASFVGGILIIDISDPNHPQQIGVEPLLEEKAFGLELAHPYLFARVTGGLRIYDVSDPRRIAWVSDLSFPPFHEGDLAYKDGYVFMLADSSYVKAVDVRDPERPEVVGREQCDVCVASAIGIVGDRLLVGGRDIDMFDISDPTNIGHLYTQHSVLHPKYLAIHDTLVLVGEHPAMYPANESALSVWTLSSEDTLRLIAVDTVSGEATDVEGEDGRMLLAIAESGVVEYEFAPSNGLVRQSCYRSPMFAGPIAIEQDLAIIADNDIRPEYFPKNNCDDSSTTYATDLGVNTGELQFCGLDSGGLTLLGSFPSGFSMEWIAANHSRAYVSDASGGISVLDITSPDGVVLLDKFDIGEAALNLEATDDRLFISLDGKLAVYEVTDADLPSHAFNVPLPAFVTQVHLGDDFTVVCGYGGGTYVLRLFADGYEQLAHIPSVGQSISAFVQGDYLYIGELWEGIQILNISDPTAPEPIARIERIDKCNKIIVVDTFLISVPGPWIFSIADPSNPIYLGGLRDGSLADIEMHDGLIMSAASYEGVKVIDWSDPSDIKVVDHEPTPSFTLSADLVGSMLLVADVFGVIRFRVQSELHGSVEPIDFTLHQNYPNPFNPLTRIAFTLETEGHVKLEVFNVLGQRVSVLRDEVMHEGNNIVYWDAEGLASGVYLCRLIVGEQSQTMKMLLLK